MSCCNWNYQYFACLYVTCVLYHTHQNIAHLTSFICIYLTMLKTSLLYVMRVILFSLMFVRVDIKIIKSNQILIDCQHCERGGHVKVCETNGIVSSSLLIIKMSRGRESSQLYIPINSPAWLWRCYLSCSLQHVNISHNTSIILQWGRVCLSIHLSACLSVSVCPSSSVLCWFLII